MVKDCFSSAWLCARLRRQAARLVTAGACEVAGRSGHCDVLLGSLLEFQEDHPAHTLADPGGRGNPLLHILRLRSHRQHQRHLPGVRCIGGVRQGYKTIMSLLRWMIAAMLVLPPVFFGGVWILLDRDHRTKPISTHPSLGIKLSHYDDCLILTKYRAVNIGPPKQTNARTKQELFHHSSGDLPVCRMSFSPETFAKIQELIDKLFVKPGWRGFRYSASRGGWTLTMSTWMPTLLTSPLLIPFVILMHGSHRHRRRARAGRCVTCGYNLTGNVSGICPECGEAIPTEMKVKMTTDPPRR